MDEIHNDTPINPKDFILLCYPAWARVYIELTYGHDVKDDRLSWNSDKVKKEFISLTGFDPYKLQYADLFIQHVALKNARELDAALYSADEVEQLDGIRALQFANGWISAANWLNDEHNTETPDATITLMNATRQSKFSKSPEEFINGFCKRAAMIGFVA